MPGRQYIETIGDELDDLLADEDIEGYDDDDFDDIEGDDDDDFEDVGARRRRLRRRKVRSGRRRRMAVPGNTGRGKRLLMGLGSYSALAAGGTVKLSDEAQKPFRPDYLVVTADATGMVIVDFKIGTSSQLAGQEAVPQELFDPSSFDPMADDFEVISKGIQVAVDLRNDSAAARSGAAGMKGASIV